MSVPSITDLECLIMWPRGTRGWEAERELILVLDRLCREHGYGRVPQVVEGIEVIWRNPAKVADYREVQKEHLEFMAECRKAIAEENDAPG